MQVFANDIDVTSYVSKNSIRITEQLNNRANTCSFTLDNYDISEGAKIEVFETFVLRAQASSWQAVLNVSDTFEFENKFKAGDEILLRIKEASEVFVTILSVDHTAKTINLTANLAATIPVGSQCWRIVFSGVTQKNPNQEIWTSGSFSYKITATDWTKIFDAKNIADTFENQYSREMIGRVLYGFVANDTESTLDLFESAWTESGVALAMSADATDRIQGTNSMQTGTSGSWTALWTKTISSVDISAMTRIRFWFKISEDYWSSVTSLKFRVGSDSSNYYEYSTAWVWVNNEDCWNFDSFDIARATVVGTPDESAIEWIQIEVVASATIPTGNLHFDHALASSGGFTIKNVIRGDKKFSDVRVQYKKPTVFVENISKLQNFFWFIDYERNIHFFKSDATPAPFWLTDSSENYADLNVTTDISQVKNRQTVRGWIAVDSNLYTQDEITDWEAESWRLDYPAKTLRIYVDTTGTWSSFVEKTVWVENLDDPADFEYLFNFSEKVVRRSTDTVPPAWSIFRRTYYPYKPIRVRVINQVSVDAMQLLLGGDGIFDGAVINDSSIRTFAEARTRGRAELDAYANPIITAEFTTQQDGLKAGQVIHITDSSRWIDADFLIQSVTKWSRNDDRWTYRVNCGSTMFWLIEFFQLLLAQAGKFEVDISEIVDVVLNQDETITFTPSITFTQKTAPFKATSNLTKWFDFIAESGTFTTSWLMTSSAWNTGWSMVEAWTEVATVQFDTSARYNAGKAMKMTTTIGWSGQTLTVANFVRIPATPSANYALSVWFEILTALTGSGGFSVNVKEYAAITGGSPLATTAIIASTKTARDYNRSRQTFTTNASTAFIEIELKIDNAVWTVSVGELKLEDLSTESTSLPAVASFCETI